MEWPGCGKNVSSFFCATLRSLLALGAYSDYVRTKVVQAQYFKDPWKYEEYLSKNIFLPYINNEVASKRRSDYRDNLASLDLLLLYMWEDDQVGALFLVSPLATSIHPSIHPSIDRPAD